MGLPMSVSGLTSSRQTFCAFGKISMGSVQTRQIHFDGVQEKKVTGKKRTRDRMTCRCNFSPCTPL